MPRTRLILFGLVAFAQLFVAGKMIFDRQQILNEGSVYKFLMEPVDPNDPFRGKFLILGFESDYVDVMDSVKTFDRGMTCNVLLGTDENGFAQLLEISEEAPGSEYLQLKVQQVNNIAGNGRRVFFEMPFDRYYINEQNAEAAEKVLREELNDNMDKPYAVVRIRDGRAVLEDLVLGKRSISELLQD
ncbi:MAG: GDYXXLXY domain-containing protein [Cyclobacteriaceae bacterium]